MYRTDGHHTNRLLTFRTSKRTTDGSTEWTMDVQMVGIDDGKNILEEGKRDGLMEPGGRDQGSEGGRDKGQWGVSRGNPH